MRRILQGLRACGLRACGALRITGLPSLRAETISRCGDLGGALAAADDGCKAGQSNGAIDRGNDQIELGAFVRAGQDHADRVEQVLALEPGAILHAIREGAERVLVGETR